MGIVFTVKQPPLQRKSDVTQGEITDKLKFYSPSSLSDILQVSPELIASRGEKGFMTPVTGDKMKCTFSRVWSVSSQCGAVYRCTYLNQLDVTPTDKGSFFIMRCSGQFKKDEKQLWVISGF